MYGASAKDDRDKWALKISVVNSELISDDYKKRITQVKR